MAERRLRRGLDQLLGKGAPPPAGRPERGEENVQEIPVAAVRANPHQPRENFKAAELEALERSIRAEGLLQPLVVRRVDGGFELIAGERRLRAVRQLGWTTVPAIVREAEEEQRLLLALVENLLREDLDPLEEARAFRSLHQDFGLTHERIAERVGRSRAAVTNALRLLELPESIQAMVSRGTLSAGHARALLGLPRPEDREVLAGLAARKGWTVRRTEEEVRRRTSRGRASQSSERPGATGAPAPAVRDAEDRLRAVWGVTVRVIPAARGGVVRMECRGREEFLDLVERLLEGRAERSERPPPDEREGTAFSV